MLSFEPERPWEEEDVSAKPFVLEFGMGVDVHGGDCTTAACRAVSDAIRHSSLPFFTDVRKRGGRMLVDVTVGVPDPASVDVERVRRELPHGEVTVRAQSRRAPCPRLRHAHRVRGHHGERRGAVLTAPSAASERV